jgi:transcriptional regulator with XRE-family HTH domain
MQSKSSKSVFGRFLKFWRGVHSVSQEELAGRLGSSPRHISRLENGSSRASESLVMDIARVLSLGKRDLNHLLIAAGFAPNEQPVDFNAPELKWLRKAMTMHLRTLDPYPASVVDGSVNILMVNRGWVKFYGSLVDAKELTSVRNFYDFIFAQGGSKCATGNWADTLSAILMSSQQSALFTGEEGAEKALTRLQSYPCVPGDWRQRAAHTEPMASFRVQINIAGELKRFFSVGTMAGALGPSAFASQPQLSIITLYPEDETHDFGLQSDEKLSHPLLFY